MEQKATVTAPASPATVPPPPAYHRRMRNYLVDTNLQLRLASYLVLAAGAVTAAMAALLWKAYRETSAVIALAEPMVGQMLAQEDRRRMIWLALSFAVIAVALLTLALVVTHRVAGPAFYLARSCRKVGEGHLTPLRPLRKRDLLVPLAEEIGLMIRALRDREASERAALGAIATRLRHPGASPNERQCAEILDGLAGEKARRIGA